MARSRREKVLRKTFKVSAAEGLFAQVFMTLAGTGSVFIHSPRRFHMAPNRLPHNRHYFPIDPGGIADLGVR